MSADQECPERPFDVVARELAEVGTSALGLALHVDLVFTVREGEHVTGEKLLHTELVTGEYHKATLTLTSAPILPPDVPWGGGVHAAVCEVWGTLSEAIENYPHRPAIKTEPKVRTPLWSWTSEEANIMPNEAVAASRRQTRDAQDRITRMIDQHINNPDAVIWATGTEKINGALLRLRERNMKGDVGAAAQCL